MNWTNGPSAFLSGAVVMLGFAIISNLKLTEDVNAQIVPQFAGNSSNSSGIALDQIDLDNLNIPGASGTFTSLQNDSENIMWITSGKWSISANPSKQSDNSSGVMFNATVDMAKTNNPNNHRSRIYDFKYLDGSINSTDKVTTIILNGTASIDTENGLYIDVPVSLKIVDREPIIVSIDTQSNRVIPKWIPGGGTMSLWIDSGKTDDHFGNTPIFGIVKRA
jgi:hypothetical protein